MKLKLALLPLAWCSAAWAQSSAGYVFFAPGGATAYGHTSGTIQAGIGGEGILGKGIGVGADIGAWAPSQSLSGAIGVFSPNVSYHFIHDKRRKIDPYVTGGYTLFFRTGTENLFNFGVGTNYWFARRVGLRVEFRDQVYTQTGTAHFWGVRLGVAFR